MSENEYRSRLVWTVLKKVGRTRFDSVLDLGCADGTILRVIAESVGSRRALGIDLNVPETDAGAVVLRRGSFLEFRPDEPFDLVLSNQVFEHIYEPWLPKYFSALKASCNARGMVLLSTPNRWRPRNLLRLLALRRPSMMQPNPGVPPEEHLGHHRECSFRELRAILEGHFPETDWHIRFIRLAPRFTESTARLLVNLAVYWVGWILWRPVFASASQDHYIVVSRKAG